MLQRLQSIFLALAGASLFGTFGLPFAETTAPVSASELFADTEYTVQDNIGLIIIFALAGLLAIGGVFLFRNRPLQIRVSIFAFIATLIGLILGAVFFMQDSVRLGDAAVDDGFGIYLPVLGGALLLFAIRYIRKDEKLVRSADRLR